MCYSPNSPVHQMVPNCRMAMHAGVPASQVGPGPAPVNGFTSAAYPAGPLSLSMHDTMVFPAHPNLPQHARAKFQKVELRHYAESLYLRLRCEERCLPIAAVADWKHQGGCWESGEI